YFKQLKEDSVKTLFEGIDQSWNRLADGSAVEKLIDVCIKKYNAQSPEKIIPDLISVYKQIQSLPSGKGEIAFWKLQKLKETESLILSCSGLWMEAYAADFIGIPGKEINITAQIVNRNISNVKLNRITFFGQTDTLVNMSVKHNELITVKHNEILPASTSFSNPYWLNEKHEAGIFTVNDLSLIGKPEKDNGVMVLFHIEINGLSLQIERELNFKSTDPVKGEVYRPFEILPPATVNISEKVFVFGDKSAKSIQFTIKANTANIEGRLGVTVSEGWNLQMKNKDFKLNEKGDEIMLEATVNPSEINSAGKLTASLHINGTSKKVYSKSIARIEHHHIPYQFILSDAEAKLINTEIKKAGTNIGYIPGAGDEIPACLKQIGYRVTTLTDDMLANENLSAYDAIVTGIRAHNTNERLQTLYIKLM
ncbi:MAG: LmbE family protein, partial [Bacteroidia bacterium]|nr:LmbE family protein [Bacteroidia bacterium]